MLKKVSDDGSISLLLLRTHSAMLQRITQFDSGGMRVINLQLDPTVRPTQQYFASEDLPLLLQIVTILMNHCFAKQLRSPPVIFSQS